MEEDLAGILHSALVKGTITFANVYIADTIWYVTIQMGDGRLKCRRFAWSKSMLEWVNGLLA